MSLISKIITQCRCTFEPKNKEFFQKNFTHLKELVSNLTYSELRLNPNLVNRRAFEAPRKAPCTFVNVYECELFTLTIFILRAGYQMPMHDHPGIHGILRMIYGTARIQSYNRIGEGEEEGNQISSIKIGQRIQVKANEPIIADPSTGVAVLSPNEANFHDITAIGDTPCAFFDVLSPPFGHSGEAPECSYYQKVEGDEEYLEKIPAPFSYWCDSYYYDLPEDCEDA